LNARENKKPESGPEVLDFREFTIRGQFDEKTFSKVPERGSMNPFGPVPYPKSSPIGSFLFCGFVTK
jgi:hypothetical protein